ncbi:MAG TPA: riboflavin kinase [Candidatus Saccharimonadales bacterium]
MQPTILKGTTTRFKGDGRKLGYPTANLNVPTDLKDGVYFGFADLANWSKQPAIIFVGTPTTMGETGRRVEAHLLDIPDEDYYELPLTLDIRHHHRANQTFAGADELMRVMRADEATGREWFSNGNGRP